MDPYASNARGNLVSMGKLGISAPSFAVVVISTPLGLCVSMDVHVHRGTDWPERPAAKRAGTIT